MERSTHVAQSIAVLRNFLNGMLEYLPDFPHPLQRALICCFYSAGDIAAVSSPKTIPFDATTIVIARDN